MSDCSGVRLLHLHCCNRYGSTVLFGYPRHHRSQCFAWELGSFLCGTPLVANSCFCNVAGSLSLSARVVSLSVVVCCRGRRQCGVHSGSVTLRLCSTTSSTVMWQVTFAVAHLRLLLHHLLCQRPLLLPTFGVLLRFMGYLWYTHSARSIVLSWCSGLLWDLWVVHGVFDVGYGSVAGTNYCELMNS